MTVKVLQICKTVNFALSKTNPIDEVLLGAKDCQKKFVLLHGDPDAQQTRSDAEVVVLSSRKGHVKKKKLRMLSRLYRVVRSFSPEVIITHRITPTIFIGLLQPLLPKSRKICFIHGMGQLKKPRRRLFFRLFLRDWRFVAVSNGVRDDLVSQGIPPERVSVIRNAVDIELLRERALSREQARAELGLDATAFVVGTLGRLHPVKDQSVLVEAASRARHPWQVVIIGGGTLEAELEQSVHKQGLEDRVSLAGQLPDGYRYCRAFDLFVLPSLSEGLPLALIEAIALGVPALGTPVGGIPEVLINKDWLVPVKDPQALGTRIDSLYELGAAGLEVISEQQYAYVREQFSVQRFHREIARLLHDASPNETPLKQG